MKNLYVVEITVRAVVAADDEFDACIVAEDNWRDIARDTHPQAFVEHIVLEERHLPTGWDLGCLPYGSDGSTRMIEMIKKGK